jgi:hypothetical protein
MPPDVSALAGNDYQDRALAWALRGTNGREADSVVPRCLYRLIIARVYD